MKKLIIIALGVLCAVSCSRHDSIVKAEKILNDSICSINVSYPVFSSNSRPVNDKFRTLNDAIETYVDTLTSSVISEAGEMFAELSRNDIPRPEWDCELTVESAAYLSDNIASVLFTTYTYMGGAHGMTEYKAINFDIRKGEILSNESLIDYTQASRINELLRSYFENPDSCFWEQPSLDKVSAIVMEKSGPAFIFEQYVLGPYSCGAATVKIPASELRGILRVTK